MIHALGSFFQNLFAGLRVAVFLPVRRGDFRVGVGQLLLLFVLSAALDFAGDWIRYNPGAYFSLYGMGSELFSIGLLLCTAAVLALAFGQRALVIALPVVVLAALPLIQILHGVDDVASRWWPTERRAVGDLDWIFIAWLVVVLIRATAIAIGPATRRRWPRALAGGLALAAPLWLAPALTPTEPWWRQPGLHGGIDPRYPNPASEEVLATQTSLLDEALDGLEDEREGVTDLYFVAFGGYASEDVFRNDVEAARKIMDERWETKGRSVVLLNNPRTSLEIPFASVTHLRETLTEIGGAIDTDEDVVMIYLTSHGAPGRVEVSLPPLELSPVTPRVLKSMLDEAGITWRIIVVSSCYSGTFIPDLKDEHTMIITAAQADRTSFGCGYRSDRTYFGEALFDEGFAKADSITAAFERARVRIAEREAEERVSPPSNPQLFVGAAMAEKLKELERGNTNRRSGRLVCGRCADLTHTLATTQNRRPRRGA